MGSPRGRLQAPRKAAEGVDVKKRTASEGMFMIVGLGNPGREYMHNRHNVGYQMIRRFSENHAIRLRTKRKLASRVGVAQVAGRRVVAVEPRTFMNRSGQAVASAVGFYGVNPKEVLVILDDVNLPLGRLRIRTKGSDGGHNGLRSIITWLGTTEFSRLRIGVGNDNSRSLTGFVLGDFTEDERRVIGEAIERAAEAVDTVIAEGISAAMNRYNRSGEGVAGGRERTE